MNGKSYILVVLCTTNRLRPHLDQKVFLFLKYRFFEIYKYLWYYHVDMILCIIPWLLHSITRRWYCVIISCRHDLALLVLMTKWPCRYRLMESRIRIDNRAYVDKTTFQQCWMFHNIFKNANQWTNMFWLLSCFGWNDIWFNSDQVYTRNFEKIYATLYTNHIANCTLWSTWS